MHRARRAIALGAAALLALTLSACSPEPATVVDRLPAQAEGQLPEEVRGQLQASVEHAMAASGATGALVGVWVPWAGSWVTGVGSTALEGAAVDADMTFRAGPITRAMTCDVLYAVADAGQVDLDDTVSSLLIGMDSLENVTLGQLCDSTSGLGGYTNQILNRMLLNPERPWVPKELIAYGMASGLSGEPGGRYRDSDTGYLLLGVALERATGTPMAELYDQYVAEPLELTATGLSSAPAGNNPLPAYWAANTEGKADCSNLLDVTELSTSAGYAAAGVTTNITELGRYVQALATEVRPYDAEGRFAEPLQISSNQPSWFTAKGGTYQAGSLIGQYGSFPGYLTAAFADRETGMTVAVVLNNSRGSSVIARSLAWQLAAIGSKIPGADGAVSETALPWTAESLTAVIDENAICS